MQGQWVLILAVAAFVVGAVKGERDWAKKNRKR